MSYHRAPRIDKSQPAIVEALEVAGWWVYKWSKEGGPMDLLVSNAYGGVVLLIECKTPGAPAKRRLKERCYRFMLDCPLAGAICTTPEEALRAAYNENLESCARAARQYFYETGEKFS